MRHLTDIHKPLSSQGDILANVFWRFLQLRGYIDEKHQLTAWGTCLEQALSVLDPEDNLEESTFIAIELLRMGILSSKDWFSHVSGGPMRGSGKHIDSTIRWRCETMLTMLQTRTSNSTHWFLVLLALESSVTRALDIPAL